MDIDRGTTRIYNCPICQVDTPHIVKGRRGETFAIVCTNCASGSIVRGDELRLYQLQWEEELRQILNNLERDLGDEEHPDG